MTDTAPLALLWLHEGGWDEVIMVAVGLVVAYLVIVWTGRRSKDAEDDDDYEDDEIATDSAEQSKPPPPQPRSTERPPGAR
ncbi:MAG: hypothetical protein U0893_22735 [Chloroflexota bacterium]